MDTIDHDNTRTKPAAKPREGKKILRAKPVKGDVDRAALTDKIIARFPNILKALAE
jgi:hypothetical protein